MIHSVKNSSLQRCLGVLLIGYFLMSSINISTSIDGLVSQNSIFHSSHIAGNMLKMIFKCDGCPEEINDYEAKTKSSAKSNGLLMHDYLIPSQLCDAVTPALRLFQKKGCNGNVALQCNFSGKIHLPPPEHISQTDRI